MKGENVRFSLKLHVTDRINKAPPQIKYVEATENNENREREIYGEKKG